MNKTISGQVVLVTGAGGSIGSALVKAIVGYDPHLVILLDHSERNLHQIESELAQISNSTQQASVLGDVGDKRLISETLERYRPSVIYHAAAFKHVPLMEANPLAAIRNNAIGTYVLAQAAQKLGVSNLVMISTDKAVNPRSVMGASKRIAELALLRWSRATSRMTSIRLGNVLGTEGSVSNVFQQQILACRPVTVTHSDVTRYFLTLQEAVDLMLLAAELEGNGGILIPQLGNPVKILDLAHRMIKEAGFDSTAKISVTITGLRPGDKMTEEFISDEEIAEPTSESRLSRILSVPFPSDGFDASIKDLKNSVERRDLSSLLELLHGIVPKYQPSENLVRLVERAPA